MIDDSWIDTVRREAASIVAMRNWTGTVVVTSYNPAKHTIKGMLVPDEIETGEIPIGVGAMGNGFGDICGPKCGTATELDGDQFIVQFDAGDPNTLIATHRIFSDQDVPPSVKPGEMMRKSAMGQRIYQDESGNTTIDLASGTMVKLKHNNDIVVKVAAGGTVYHGGDPDDGGTYDFVKTVSGVASNVKVKIG